MQKHISVGTWVVASGVGCVGRRCGQLGSVCEGWSCDGRTSEEDQKQITASAEMIVSLIWRKHQNETAMHETDARNSDSRAGNANCQKNCRHVVRKVCLQRTSCDSCSSLERFRHQLAGDTAKNKWYPRIFCNGSAKGGGGVKGQGGRGGARREK